MARLRIKREGREDEVVPVASDIVTLGRSSEATVPIEDNGASRKHAQIERFEGGYKLVDLESRNGTRVNGVHVNQHLLQWNDEIQIGKTTIVWEAGDSELLPESKGEMTPAAMAVAGVKPPRVHITRRRTSALRKGGHGIETKILIALVTISVLFGFVAFLKRESPVVVETKSHMNEAGARKKKAEALNLEDRTSQVLRDQIRLFEEAVKEYQQVPSSETAYFREASERIAEIQQVIKDRKELLPAFRAEEITSFAKAHVDDIDAIKLKVSEFKAEFPGHAKAAELDAMVKQMTTKKPEDLTAQYAALEAEVDAFLVGDMYGKALHSLQDFSDKHPSSEFATKAEDRIKEVQGKAGEFWNAEHAKAQELVKAGKVADAVGRYERVIGACGDESLLSDFVLQAKSEMKLLKDKKDK